MVAFRLFSRNNIGPTPFCWVLRELLLLFELRESEPDAILYYYVHHYCNPYYNNSRIRVSGQDCYSSSAYDQLNRENDDLSVPVRAALEFGLVRQVRPSRPGSACSFSTYMPDFLLCSLFPVQQTTSGIGDLVKYGSFFGLATNTLKM